MKKRIRPKMYRRWRSMIERCERVNGLWFSTYGGRGIKVCERWRRSFNDFVSDMGCPPSDGMSIERIDNNGDYCPENCKWATWNEQARNRRGNRFIIFQGVRMTIAQAVDEIGCARSTINIPLWAAKVPKGIVPFLVLRTPRNRVKKGPVFYFGEQGGLFGSA